MLPVLVCFVVVVYLICPRIYMVGIVINCTEQIKKLRLRETRTCLRPHRVPLEKQGTLQGSLTQALLSLPIPELIKKSDHVSLSQAKGFCVWV